MKKQVLLMAMGLIMATAVNAQEEPKLSIKPSGRILFDAAYINPQNQKDELKSGVAIPDMRVGVGFSYGKWKAKLDIGYAYGKVGLKDVFVQYDFDKLNSIRGGYFIHQYGFQSSTSSSFKETMEEPQSNAVFNNDRTLGVMYEYNGKKFLGTASIIVETEAMKRPTDEIGNEGIGAQTRLLYRPFTELVVTDAKTMYKFSPEIMYSYGHFAVIGQYFLNTITRDNGKNNFTGSGAYVTLRGLIKGRNYAPNMVDGGIATPDPGNMDICLQYNYTSLSDAKADIRGGYLSDWAICYNYYINKYMIWRVRASYTKVTNRSGFDNNEVSILETRFQVKF